MYSVVHCSCEVMEEMLRLTATTQERFCETIKSVAAQPPRDEAASVAAQAPCRGELR